MPPQHPRARRNKTRDRSDPLTLAVEARDENVLQMVDAALRSNQTMLVYQPVVLAAQPRTVAFCEGLVRILDATGRVIPAADFIGAIKDHELGRMIDCAALSRGLEALSLNPGLRLSINMSARSIGYRQWMQILDDGLQKDADVGHRLILEISEQSAMQMPEIVISFMDELQSRGISFAIDGFGAGPISLAQLNEFYFDIMKISAEFTRDIHKHPEIQHLVKGLVDLGRHFEMFTVAERVEDAKEARSLIDTGIDCMQGYYFGAPAAKPPKTQPPAAEQASA